MTITRTVAVGSFAVVLFTGLGLASVSLLAPKPVAVAERDLRAAPPLTAEVRRQSVGVYHDDAEMEQPLSVDPGVAHYFRCPQGGLVSRMIQPTNAKYWGYVFSGQETVNSLTGREVWDGPWFASQPVKDSQDTTKYRMTEEIPAGQWVYVTSTEPVTVDCSGQGAVQQQVRQDGAGKNPNDNCPTGFMICDESHNCYCEGMEERCRQAEPMRRGTSYCYCEEEGIWYCAMP